MYKKLLLATSLAALSVPAMSATWSTAGLGIVAVEHTDEGIANVTEAAGAQASNAVIKLGADFALNDTIKFTYSAAKATNYNWPTNIYSIAPGTATATHEIAAIEAVGQVEVATKVIGAAASIAGFKVGDVCTFESDSTATSYRVIGLGGVGGVTANHLKVSPAVQEATVVGKDVTCVNPKFITFSLINSDTTSVTYRVTALAGTGATSTVGAEVPVPAILVSPDGLAAADVTVSYSAATASNVAMDTTAATAIVAASSTELSYAITTKFNAVVDVETDRVDFASGFDGTDVEDDLVLTIAKDAGTAGNYVSTNTTGVLTLVNAVAADVTDSNSAVITVTGDVAFLDDNAAAGVTAAAAGFTEAGADSTAIDAVAGAYFKITDTTIGANASTVTSTIKNTEGVAIPTSSFTASAVITYESAGDATLTKTIDLGSAGAWTLNGASVTAYGVPMGDAVSRFLWVSNKGTSSAAVSYTATMNGSSYGPYSIATVPGKSSVSVGGLIDTDLAARGIYVAPSSRASIELSAPVKANDITVSASYKHIGDADRLGLETSDTLTVSDAK